MQFHWSAAPPLKLPTPPSTGVVREQPALQPEVWGTHKRRLEQADNLHTTLGKRRANVHIEPGTMLPPGPPGDSISARQLQTLLEEPDMQAFSNGLSGRSAASLAEHLALIGRLAPTLGHEKILRLVAEIRFEQVGQPSFVQLLKVLRPYAVAALEHHETQRATAPSEDSDGWLPRLCCNRVVRQLNHLTTAEAGLWLEACAPVLTRLHWQQSIRFNPKFNDAFRLLKQVLQTSRRLRDPMLRDRLLGCVTAGFSNKPLSRTHSFRFDAQCLSAVLAEMPPGPAGNALYRQIARTAELNAPADAFSHLDRRQADLEAIMLAMVEVKFDPTPPITGHQQRKREHQTAAVLSDPSPYLPGQRQAMRQAGYAVDTVDTEPADPQTPYQLWRHQLGGTRIVHCYAMPIKAVENVAATLAARFMKTRSEDELEFVVPDTDDHRRQVIREAVLPHGLVEITGDDQRIKFAAGRTTQRP